jgi:hypothetical protein
MLPVGKVMLPFCLGKVMMLMSLRLDEETVLFVMVKKVELLLNF